LSADHPVAAAAGNGRKQAAKVEQS